MGGAPSKTTSTVTQSNLPEYAKPYYQSLMARGMDESQQPYTPYTGQRLAGQSGATQAGLSAMEQYAGTQPTLLNNAAATTQEVTNRALGTNYAGSNVSADQVGTTAFGGQQAAQYMSPYMDAVVGRAQQNATQNFMTEQAQRNLQAAKAGSFGGSRAAVQQQMAINSHQDNLTDIFVQGQQSAFENAQQQFNADQGRSLQAQTSNQGANLKANELNEQSRQFGANLGLQGLELASKGAQQMAGLQEQTDAAQIERAKALLGVGQTREDYLQQQLDQSYGDFVNQRDAEKQNLQFLSSLLQGVPVSANSDVTQTQSGGSNNLAGALGSIGGLQALYALGKT